MANQGKRMVSEDQIKKLENLADIREAGDGITIEDGVIKATGGSGPTSKLYLHQLDLWKESTIRFGLLVISKQSTPWDMVSARTAVAVIPCAYSSNLTPDYITLGVAGYKYSEPSTSAIKIYYMKVSDNSILNIAMNNLSRIDDHVTPIFYEEETE